MKNLHQYSLSHLEEAEEKNLSKKFLNELENEIDIEFGPLRLKKGYEEKRAKIQANAWYVVDTKNNKIVNGPYEDGKMATHNIEDQESLSNHSVVKGSEVLKRYKIMNGLFQ